MNCNNPYGTTMGMAEPNGMGYQGNVGYPQNMSYPTNMGYMGMDGYGYNQMMPQVSPGCNQVVQKCFVEEIPYYVGYNTHVVNNVVRRHIQIPVYSQSQETFYFDEWQSGCGCGCNR